jgi:sulfoxide reductase catalytic subunit YedY
MAERPSCIRIRNLFTAVALFHSPLPSYRVLRTGALMLIRNSKLYGDDIASSEITPQALFLNGRPTRRSILSLAGRLAAGGAAASLLPMAALADDKLPTVPGAPQFETSESQTPFSKATTYNNFYEYGIDKSLPAKNAHTLQTRPWSIQVAGLVKKPTTINIDDLIRYRPLESRVYRHRCVEDWSMVIPWDGYSLSELIKFCQPLPSAKYVQFVSYLNRKQMPDLPDDFPWPYVEGLRMDEAMHPLTLLAFGVYGQELPKQNGAPVRVVLPWKYGYKSAKSIVKLVFTAEQPTTLWNELNPGAYGFYSNVSNKEGEVPSAYARERRLDGSLFGKSVPTQMFNGYGDQVASLYAGMDLTRYY